MIKAKDSREVRRLKEVRRVQNLLTSDSEASLQSIARLATTYLDMPIGLVSIVEADLQRFAANIGLSGVDHTPRVVSFCTHAVDADTNLIVPDAVKDERFSDNELVTGSPHIRAYAGSPIRVAGQPIGTVCAIDRKPRVISLREASYLEELAELTSTILEGQQWQQDTHKYVKRLKKQKSELWHKAHFDDLTDLANRGHFTDSCKSSLEYYPDQTALVIFDVDAFKGINDHFGHYVGDQCLKEIAKAMRTVVRPDDLAGRLGGDEFALMIQSEHPERAAARVFDRLQSRLADAYEHRGFALSLSAGCGTAKSNGRCFDSLYKAADTALYHAKAAGKNQIHFNDGGMVVRSSQRKSFRRGFLNAVKRGELIPYYQPKISLSNGYVSGFEVLARWKQPDGGVQTPASFCRAFDDEILSRALVKQMLEQATLDHVQVVKASGKALRLGINVTAHDLAESSFAQLVINTLESRGIPRRHFTIEVTENVMLGNEESQAFRSLQTLREAGVQIAFDDFGTGYGSLQHLASWPIDRVKFDSSLLRQALKNERAMFVLSSMIATCKRLGMVVVIEGIETEQQAYLLSELGADVGQGYYFAKPFPRDELKNYLTNFTPHFFQQSSKAP